MLPLCQHAVYKTQLPARCKCVSFGWPTERHETSDLSGNLEILYENRRINFRPKIFIEKILPVLNNRFYSCGNVNIVFSIECTCTSEYIQLNSWTIRVTRAINFKVLLPSRSLINGSIGRKLPIIECRVLKKNSLS